MYRFGVVVMIQTCIPDVAGLYPDRVTRYLRWEISCSFWSLQAIMSSH